MIIVASQTVDPSRTLRSMLGGPRLTVTRVCGGSSKLDVIPKRTMLAMTVTTATTTMKMTTQIMTFLRESSGLAWGGGYGGWPG
jgi:hypothetical protein